MKTTKRRLPPPKKTTSGLFLFLLVSCLSMFFMAPLLESSYAAGIIGDVLFYLMLIFAMFSIRFSRFFWLALVLMSATLMGDLFCYLIQDNTTIIVTNFLACSFLLVVTALIIAFVIRQDRISLDAVMGGLCAYLLLGVCWSLLYVNLELLSPGTFAFELHGAPANADETFALLFYYSFVVLLTIGFGDIVPMSKLAQSLTILEGLIGQFYLVFFISMLVGMYLSERLARK